MKRTFPILFISSIAFWATSCRQDSNVSKLKEEWNYANNPLHFLPSSFESRLDYLPQSATLQQTPWSDSYWPTNWGGIAQRWNNANTSRVDNFNYQPLNPQQLQQMSLSEIAKLSPAEKFDILNSDYSYPLLRNERSRTNPNAASWEGICHGWASASINFQEPKAVIVQNNQGIQIPFGSADVKALINLFTGNHSNARQYYVAERCNIDLAANPEAAHNPECRDTNAGTFHLVLANRIGVQGQGFVADITRDFEVWNHPIYGYESQILSYNNGASPGAAPGTVREVNIRTVMQYVSETGTLWNNGTINEATTEFEYRLELNAYGQIIGGEWLTERRPDFLWSQDRTQFYDTSGVRYSSLNWLYQQSLNSPENIPNPAEQ